MGASERDAFGIRASQAQQDNEKRWKAECEQLLKAVSLLIRAFGFRKRNKQGAKESGYQTNLADSVASAMGPLCSCRHLYHCEMWTQEMLVWLRLETSVSFESAISVYGVFLGTSVCIVLTMEFL